MIYTLIFCFLIKCLPLECFFTTAEHWNEKDVLHFLSKAFYFLHFHQGQKTFKHYLTTFIIFFQIRYCFPIPRTMYNLLLHHTVCIVIFIVGIKRTAHWSMANSEKLKQVWVIRDLKKQMNECICSHSILCIIIPVPTSNMPLLPSWLLSFLLTMFLLVSSFLSATPFNRFPHSSVGIANLGSYRLAQFQNELRQLHERAKAMERMASPKVITQQISKGNNGDWLRQERNARLAQLLVRRGFRDEAQFEYVRRLVGWEWEKRKNDTQWRCSRMRGTK